MCFFKKKSAPKISQACILEAIATCQDPYLHQDLLSLGAVQNLVYDSAKIAFDIELGYYPSTADIAAIRKHFRGALGDLIAGRDLYVEVKTRVQSAPFQESPSGLNAVHNIVAVSSAKGGVGKSTIATNLALAFAKQGARVGLLDADIYGPSVGSLLGFEPGTRAQLVEEKYFKPLNRYGIAAMSMAFLVDEDRPMVWRGPMVTGMLTQLLTRTLWQTLDYLIIDMPPGTGDIQLTLAQKVPVSGAVIVTTPQGLSLLDAQKGIEMFRKVRVPVLGVVENMASYQCACCGHKAVLFGAGGGARLAKKYAVDLLASLPFSTALQEFSEQGKPLLAVVPSTDLATIYQQMATHIGALLWQRALHKVIPEIVVSED